jgi:predicted NAD/FAD-dependent oxidoreductase
MADRPTVAVVGGGICGAVAASALGERGCNVHLFDQGRRGPGGRASHRAVNIDSVAPTVLADDPPIPPSSLEFDHGCQFFRADEPRMGKLVGEWCAHGWAAEWQGRFGSVGVSPPDFFGLPSVDSHVFVGVGGMHRLPRQILSACDPDRVLVHRGVRVAGMRQEAGKWCLLGVMGEAAFHDTAEAKANAESEVLGRFDVVLLTDVSSSFHGWHRASAGVPEAFASKVRDRARVPLFAAMVAFKEPLGLPLDGISFGVSRGERAEASAHSVDSTSPLWWATRTQSKPGLEDSGEGRECWTLISTPGFAVDEITSVPMQDAKTGAFRPQEDGYLNSGPAPALVREFLEQVDHLRPQPGSPTPAQLYLQGQRWGSALPAPRNVGGRDGLGHGASTVRILDVAYDRSVPPLVFSRPQPANGDEATADYFSDEALGLYYAGDFTSHRAPGFEASVLAALDATQHILLHVAR